MSKSRDRRRRAERRALGLTDLGRAITGLSSLTRWQRKLLEQALSDLHGVTYHHIYDPRRKR